MRLPGLARLAALRDRLVRRWLDRRIPREDSCVTLHRRRLFILPTRLGYTFGLTLALLLIGALNYGTSLGFAVAFLLAGAGTLGMLHTYRNLEGLRLHFASAGPVFAGDPARFAVTLEAPERERWAVDLEAGLEPVHQLHVGPGAPAATGLAFATGRRGRLPMPRIPIATQWPLALFRVWSWVFPGVDTLVYPAARDHGRPLPEATAGDGTGERDARGDEDFAGLREYRPGDPPRRIAWKALARSDELRVKAFESEPAGDTWLTWAALSPLPAGARYEQLCTWVLRAESAGRRYGLELPDARIEPGTGLAHRRRCLEALALSSPEQP